MAVTKTFASLFTASLLFFSVSSAQQLLFYGTNELPQCAKQCTLLTQAQAACTPPEAQATTYLTYESCFCQSAYLTNLKTDPSAVCGTVCSGSDLTAVATWYTKNCADGGVAAASSASAAAGTATTSSTTTSATTIPTSTSSGGGSSSGQSTSTSSSSHPQGWWANHWKWVVMLIVIFVVLALLAVLGVYLRRRHARRQDKNTSRFNDGITTRTTPMAKAPGSRAATFPNDSYVDNADEGRMTPQSMRPYTAAGRSESRLGSTTNLSRVRERDRSYMIRPDSQNMENGESSYGGANHGGRNMASAKGKGRTYIDQDEIRSAR